MCFQLKSVLIISSLWINFCSQKAFGCTSTTTQYTRSGKDVTIQFQARTVHSQGHSWVVVNQILYTDSILFTVTYQKGVILKIYQCNGCTFIGNGTTGALSIRIDTIQRSQAGTYKHIITDTSKEVKGCVLVYVLGEPTKPSITVNKVPVEGESITLTCSSTSTTIPKDPNLRMMYNWKVDSISPSDTRFTYSDTKNKLTISNIERTDANNQFVCTATEDISNAPTSISSDSKMIDVYYSPDSGPLIQGFNNNTLFYAIVNRPQTLTCSVTGGYPLPSLSWSCFTGSSQDEISGQTVISTRTWTTSTNRTCKCISSQMNSTVTVVLNVRILSPPTPPMFKIHSDTFQPSSTVKLLLNSNASITCSSISSPSPEYKWTYNEKQQEVIQGAILNPSNVTQDGRYYCIVNNTMIPSQGHQYIGINSAFINIQRLYAPTVQPFDIEPLVEGSPLFAECKCDLGIPTDTTFTWKRKLNSSSIIQWQDIPDSSVNESQLLIQNISKNDAGIYKCTASNLMKPTTEAQQIGSSFQTFLVDVLYPTSITSFVVEGHSGKSDVILNENDEDIHLTCEVDSKPASTVKIMFKDEVKNEVQDINKLSFKYGSVSCLDGGEYTCEGYNRIGMSSWKTIQLNVNCSPRPLSRINQNISSPLSTDVTLSFVALAFPEPGTKNFSWYKKDRDNWTQVLANMNFRIISTALKSNLTITNTTKRDCGQYKLIIKNEFGAYTQFYNLVERNVEKALSDGDLTTSKHEANNNTIIVGSVLGTLIAILIGCIVTMIIWYRRKSNRKEQESSDQNQAQTEYVNVSYDPKATDESQKNSDTNTACDDNAQDAGIKHYMDLSEYSRDDKSTYDILHTQQVQN